MTATVVVGRHLVPGLALAPLVASLALTACVNLAWTAALRWAEADRRFVPPQLALDLLLVTALLWNAGGLRSPFAVFLTFHLALGGILSTWRTTLGLLVLTFGAIAVLVGAEPLPLDTAPLGRARVELLAALVSTTSLTAFFGFVVLAYARRLRRLRDDAARNEKLAMLGRVVGGMSHELATPLATIVLAGGELAELVSGEDDEAATLARTIREEARRASDLIGLLRGHVRPDLRADRIDVSMVIGRMAGDELDRLGFLGRRALTIEPGVECVAIEVALRHVFRNLVANAVQATAGRADAVVEVQLAREADGIALRVADNGPGFSEEILARVGEPFQTTKEAEGGMGLGLYVATMLAARLGAELQVGTSRFGGAEVVLRFVSGAEVSA